MASNELPILIFPKSQDINAGPKVAIQAIRKARNGNSPKYDNAKLELVAKVKKRRTSAKKSRAGCKTCKSRHTKCDETRPKCIRCTNSGWPCDYGNIPATDAAHKFVFPLHLGTRRGVWSTIPEDHPLPPLPVFDSSQDAHYLQYMWHQFSFNPRCPFEIPLWTMLLQMCHTEPCIKHMAIGAAMVHQIDASIVKDPGDASNIDTYRAGFRHYVKAVQALKLRLAKVKGKPDNDTFAISLLASFLFTAFEVLVGNEEGSYWQMQNGFQLLHGVLDDHGLDSTLPPALEEIRYAWNRLDIQASTFSAGYETHRLFPPKIPDRFHNINEAKFSLETLVPNILALVRSKEPGWYRHRNIGDPLPPDIEEELSELKFHLHHWLDILTNLLQTLQVDLSVDPVGQKAVKFRIAHHTLMVQYWTAYIWLETPFSHSQYIHDPCLPAFQAILELVEAMHIMRPDRKYGYITESETIQPLFYVGQKCRDGETRRRAVELLKISGREGVWDGLCSATACEWIILKEEEGVPKGMVGSIDPASPAFVEDKFRLRGASISVNRLGKSLRITCSREREDGIDEMISGLVGWGEVKSIVYGEPDKLWQIGSIFG